MATVDLGKISFVNKGTYDASTTYEERDVVQFTDGALSSYVYINATPASGQTPSTGGTVNSSHWSLFAGGVSLAVGNNKLITTNSSGVVTGTSIGAVGQGVIVTSTNTLGFGSSFDELSDVGIWLDPAGGEGPAGPSSTGIAERYTNQTIFNSSNLNMRQTADGNQVITIQDAGDYFIKCAGAQGGGYQGGLGGHSWGTVTLSANDVLFCRVGQAGLPGGQDATSTTPTTSPEETVFHADISGQNNLPGGGYGDGKGGNGGGTNTGNTQSGGGATAIRLNTDASANRIIVAGGGGGGYLEGTRFASGNTSPPSGGGHGGGKVGLPPEKISEGTGAATRGGTQASGGAAGSGGNSGQNPSAGGAGGNGSSNDSCGGGGGYAGGSTATNAGGGGGSGYVGGMNAANRGMQAGVQAGSGWIYIRKVG